MYVIAIAWLYVVVMVAATEPTLAAGALTLGLWGIAPAFLFLWLFGTPARRRSAARRERGEGDRSNDRAESGPDQ